MSTERCPTGRTLDPDDTVDFSFNWADELRDGDEIDSYTLTSADELTISDEAVSPEVVTAWITATGDAEVGEKYDITCQITTVDGRIESCTLRLLIQNR